ncbi:unnamed protein product [Adineta ricciae]|uniref:Uncharacterized protein n=1 Tax=Adineta ricciae TaxID=249248 RepID=A0A815DT14_ADIRI|nr:unnamed protein product [Adineta ricciae]
MSISFSQRITEPWKIVFYHVDDTTKGWRRRAILTNMALLSERLSTIENLQKSSQTNFTALLDKTNRHAQSMTKIHESLNTLDKKINDTQKIIALRAVGRSKSRLTHTDLENMLQKALNDNIHQGDGDASVNEHKNQGLINTIANHNNKIKNIENKCQTRKSNSAIQVFRQAIVIRTIDPDNDEVPCRFAKGSPECVNVCPPASLPNETLILLNCTLLITGSESSDWYIVAVMIVDFIDSTSKTPLSSIPIQFLVHVQDSLACHVPRLTSPLIESTQCVGVQVEKSYEIPLLVETFCPNTSRITSTLCCGNGQVCLMLKQYCATLTVAENDAPLCPEHYDNNSTSAAPVTSRSTSPWFWIGPILAVLLLCCCGPRCLAVCYRKSTNADELINNDLSQTSTSTHSLPNDAELKSPASVSESYAFGEKRL